MAKKSGIHIKKSHEGRFTEWASRHGFSSVQAAASHVMANKEDYSSHVVKMANFAKNAKSWGRSGTEITPINYTPQLNVPTSDDIRGYINPMNVAIPILSAVNHFIPEQQYQPLNYIPQEYEAHPNGTGSSAIMPSGGEIYNNYYNQFKAQKLDNPARLANIMTLSKEYNVPPSQIFTNTTTPIGGSQVRYTDYTVYGNNQKPITTLRQTVGGNYVGSDMGEKTPIPINTEVAKRPFGGGIKYASRVTPQQQRWMDQEVSARDNQIDRVFKSGPGTDAENSKMAELSHNLENYNRSVINKVSDPNGTYGTIAAGIGAGSDGNYSLLNYLDRLKSYRDSQSDTTVMGRLLKNSYVPPPGYNTTPEPFMKLDSQAYQGLGQANGYGNGGSLQDGEYDLTPEQVASLRAQGYEIEEL